MWLLMSVYRVIIITSTPSVTAVVVGGECQFLLMLADVREDHPTLLSEADNVVSQS